MIELKNETIWFDQRKFEEAESQYQRSLVQKELGHVSFALIMVLLIISLQCTLLYYFTVSSERNFICHEQNIVTEYVYHSSSATFLIV